MQSKWMKILHGILHGNKWMMFHGLLDVLCEVHQREVGLTQRNRGNQSNCHWLVEMIWCHGEDLNPNLCGGLSTWFHFHFTLSLRAHHFHKLDFYFYCTVFG